MRLRATSSCFIDACRKAGCTIPVELCVVELPTPVRCCASRGSVRHGWAPQVGPGVPTAPVRGVVAHQPIPQGTVIATIPLTLGISVPTDGATDAWAALAAACWKEFSSAEPPGVTDDHTASFRHKWLRFALSDATKLACCEAVPHECTARPVAMRQYRALEGELAGALSHLRRHAGVPDSDVPPTAFARAVVARADVVPAVHATTTTIFPPGSAVKKAKPGPPGLGILPLHDMLNGCCSNQLSTECEPTVANVEPEFAGAGPGAHCRLTATRRIALGEELLLALDDGSALSDATTCGTVLRPSMVQDRRAGWFAFRFGFL